MYLRIGKGPERAFYESELRRQSWSHVRVATAWLRATEYAALLGASDLGVCLHWSSSGLDLPMKLVDMFGARLPALAIHYTTSAILQLHSSHSFCNTDYS